MTVWYDYTGGRVWYRKVESTTIANVFAAGLSSATELNASAKTSLNTTQTTLGYSYYEHPQCFWFNFTEAINISKFCILYGYANGRAGNFSNVVLEVSSDSTDGVNGNWVTGYWSGIPTYNSSEETNTRDIIFNMADITWLRVGTTGVAWSASPLIYSIFVNDSDGGGEVSTRRRFVMMV